jgi:hypothetical protein
MAHSYKYENQNSFKIKIALVTKPTSLHSRVVSYTQVGRALSVNLQLNSRLAKSYELARSLRTIRHKPFNF